MTRYVSPALVQEGERLQTPFGVATITEIDIAADWVSTTLGRWDLSEVHANEYDPDVHTAVEWLLAPALRVLTVHDRAERGCDCACTDCWVAGFTHKLTQEWTRLGHEMNIACRCVVTKCGCDES